MWGNCWEWPLPPTETVNGRVLQWMFVLRDEGSSPLFLRGRRTSGGAQWENAVYWRWRKPGARRCPQGGLACCSSWGRKESDTTERQNWRRDVNESVIFLSVQQGAPPTSARAGDRRGTVMQPGERTVEPVDLTAWRCWRGSDSGREAHLGTQPPISPEGRTGSRDSSSFPWNPGNGLVALLVDLLLRTAVSCLWTGDTSSVFLFVFQKGLSWIFFFFKGQMIIVIIGPFREQLLCALISSEPGAWCALCGSFLLSVFYPLIQQPGVLPAPYFRPCCYVKYSLIFFSFSLFVLMFFIAVKVT